MGRMFNRKTHHVRVVIDTEESRTISDETAMQYIHRLLTDLAWSPDTVDDIANVVRLTGRNIRSPEES